MREYEYRGAVAPVEVKVVYESIYYTVVRASTRVGKNGHEREVFAEGVSRPSYLDRVTEKYITPLAHDRGVSIATGRACKALAMKLRGEKIYRIQKATDLLMNC